MKKKCKSCDDMFELTKEELQMHANEECNFPEQCDECFCNE